MYWHWYFSYFSYLFFLFLTILTVEFKPGTTCPGVLLGATHRAVTWAAWDNISNFFLTCKTQAQHIFILKPTGPFPINKNAFLLQVTGHNFSLLQAMGQAPGFLWITFSLGVCRIPQSTGIWESICLLNSKSRPNSDLLYMCWRVGSFYQEAICSTQTLPADSSL